MQFPVFLPNKKEVIVREVLLKDLKYLSLYAKSSVSESVKFLESFIVTKNLNVLEKFLALLLLRKYCVDDSIAIKANKGNVKIKLDHILDNIGNIEDIKQTVTLNDVDFVLNYPSQFNSGNYDSILTVIESIHMGDDQITLAELTDNELNKVLNTLPKKLYSYLEKYAKQNEQYFTINFWKGRERLGIEEASLHLLSPEVSLLLSRLFGIIDIEAYCDYIFILSQRIPDANFLSNCTVKELDQFLVLYKQENRQREEAAKNPK